MDMGPARRETGTVPSGRPPKRPATDETRNHEVQYARIDYVVLLPAELLRGAVAATGARTAIYDSEDARGFNVIACRCRQPMEGDRRPAAGGAKCSDCRPCPGTRSRPRDRRSGRKRLRGGESALSVRARRVIGNIYRQAKSQEAAAVLYLCGHTKGKSAPPTRPTRAGSASTATSLSSLIRSNWASRRAFTTARTGKGAGTGKAAATRRRARKCGTRCERSTTWKPGPTSIPSGWG